MAKPICICIGIDFDALSVRAARVAVFRQGKKVRYHIQDLRESAGDFAKDDALAAALRAMAAQVGVRSHDRIVSCVSGKQVYVSQVLFKALPDAEMKTALRFEVRKSLPFESAGSALDYQVLDRPDPEKKGRSTIMVTVVAKALLDRQIFLLEKAGLKPWIVDVLPMAVANAYWAGRDRDEPDTAAVIIHFMPDVCNLVIDGRAVPFYSRSIYLSAEELFGAKARDLAERERQKRLDAFQDELRRSLAYYEKTYGFSNFGPLYVLGDYAANEELLSLITVKTGLSADVSTLPERLGCEAKADPGRFEVALSLALRAAENA